MRRWAAPGVALAVLAAGATTARAINITVDYSLDTTGFFASNTAARNALNAAAADISAAISPSLGAIADDVFTGTSGTATATFDWYLQYNHPVTNATIQVQDFSFVADSVTIFAGMRPLTGNTLGQGGPGGVGFGANVSGPQASWQAAINAAAANSTAGMGREAGGLNGPIIGSISGDLGAAGTNYTTSYGPTVGTIFFDNDTDNNGSVDSAATLDASWQFNHTTGVGAGKNDFYSVALHELLHSIGFGSSQSWTSLVSGTTWNGDNLKALYGGSGLNLVDGASGAHLASGLMSTRISDGITQEAVMDPSLTQGTRKFLTQADLAVLRDIGYVTVPEPGSALLLGFGLVPLLRRRRAGRAT